MSKNSFYNFPIIYELPSTYVKKLTQNHAMKIYNSVLEGYVDDERISNQEATQS